MKNILAMIIFILCLFLFISCSPVSNNDIPAPELTAPSGDYAVTASYNESGITVLFPAVLGARSYGYTFNDSSDPTAANVEFHGGSYTMKIPLPSQSSFSDEETYNITLWASEVLDTTSVSNPNWIEVKNFNATYGRTDINSLEPHGYIVERGEHSVTIAMIDEPIPGGMDYKVVIGDNEYEFSGSQFKIDEGVRSGSFTLEIYHAYIDENEYGMIPEKLEVYAYESDKPVEMRLIADGDSLVVSDIPEGISDVDIIDINTGSVIASAEKIGVNEYTFSTFIGFDSGIFQAVAKNSDGTIKSISNNVSFTTPINKVISKVMRQHYKIVIDAVPDVDLSIFSLYMEGVPTATLDAVAKDDTIELIISGLSSDTQYSGGRITAGNRTIAIGSFKTNNFIGTYAYRCPVENPADKYMNAFIVDVKSAAENSTSKYYFYVSPEDPQYTEKLRISPLIDESAGEEPISGTLNSDGYIKYNGNEYYQFAYQWNNKKWNTSTATVNYWGTESYDTSADSYTAVTLSNAGMLGISMSAETTSSYNLVEDTDGKAYLVFYNKITGGNSLAVSVGNSAIRTNIQPDEDRFGDEARYTFVLAKEENV